MTSVGVASKSPFPRGRISFQRRVTTWARCACWKNWVQRTTQNTLFGKLVREYAEAARYRIEREIGDEKIIVCAGTGGNVEEIGRLRQKLFKADSDRFVTMDELEELIERLESMSCDERISKLKLRPDRADVILPAAIVLHMITGEAGVKKYPFQSRFEGWHPARYCGRAVTQSSPTSQGTGVGVCLAHGA